MPPPAVPAVRRLNRLVPATSPNPLPPLPPEIYSRIFPFLKCIADIIAFSKLNHRARAEADAFLRISLGCPLVCFTAGARSRNVSWARDAEAWDRRLTNRMACAGCAHVNVPKHRREGSPQLCFDCARGSYGGTFQLINESTLREKYLILLNTPTHGPLRWTRYMFTILEDTSTILHQVNWPDRVAPPPGPPTDPTNSDGQEPPQTVPPAAQAPAHSQAHAPNPPAHIGQLNNGEPQAVLQANGGAPGQQRQGKPPPKNRPPPRTPARFFFDTECFMYACRLYGGPEGLENKRKELNLAWSVRPKNLAKEERRRQAAQQATVNAAVLGANGGSHGGSVAMGANGAASGGNGSAQTGLTNGAPPAVTGGVAPNAHSGGGVTGNAPQVNAGAPGGYLGSSVNGAPPGGNAATLCGNLGVGTNTTAQLHNYGSRGDNVGVGANALFTIPPPRANMAGQSVGTRVGSQTGPILSPGKGPVLYSNNLPHPPRMAGNTIVTPDSAPDFDDGDPLFSHGGALMDLDPAPPMQFATTSTNLSRLTDALQTQTRSGYHSGPSAVKLASMTLVNTQHNQSVFEDDLPAVNTQSNVVEYPSSGSTSSYPMSSLPSSSAFSWSSFDARVLPVSAEPTYLSTSSRASMR
ncbi:hypothetical protein HDU93_000378 [Gonapodya sp. JEL0774]|nr:hypothetical protein HDU93_000378 [Gonapodya sp. JEL0774]